MYWIKATVRRLRRRLGERGASAVEYGLLIAAVTSVMVATIFLLGQVNQRNYQDTCLGIAGQQDPAGDCGTGGEPQL